MIDALFGSKTRVKLLHLFLNNPGQQYYVREITRVISEQINSVRRELSNMIEIGIITSDSSDNKLYYQVNQRYEFYIPLRAIFGDNNNDSVGIVSSIKSQSVSSMESYIASLNELTDIKLAIFAGVLIKGSSAPVDVLLVGNITSSKASKIIKYIESKEGREINYSVMNYEDFYYRLSVRDKFITEILNNKHNVIIDRDKILNK